MRKKKRIKWILLIIICALIIPIIGKLIVNTSLFQIQKIRWYARMHETFSLGEITDFDWDVAYYDGANYGAGELIKEKYKLDFSIKPKTREDITRMLFFKNGVLVKVFSINFGDICFSSDFERCYPDTPFNVKWSSQDFDARLDLLVASETNTEGLAEGQAVTRATGAQGPILCAAKEKRR